nr:ASC1-like protein [Ipomoea batatas]
MMQKMAASWLNWNMESYPDYQDFFLLPFLLLYFPTLRFILDRSIFEKMARRMILGEKHGNMEIKKGPKRKKIDKFKESAWKFLHYFSSEAFALYVCYDEPWLTNTKYFWMGPGDNLWPDHKYKPKMKGYYMYAGGFYIYSIFALVFWETRRSDFAAQMAHHITSVSLILSSYILRFGRVGSMVLLLHEGCDVFMEFAKMSRYSGFYGLSDFSFLGFVLSWIIGRLILFPFWVLKSTSYDVVFILGKDKHGRAEVLYYFMFNALLFGLMLLHIYWTKMILRMLIGKIRNGQISDDVRSDSESDDEHDD